MSVIRVDTQSSSMTLKAMNPRWRTNMYWHISNSSRGVENPLETNPLCSHLCNVALLEFICVYGLEGRAIL